MPNNYYDDGPTQPAHHNRPYPGPAQPDQGQQNAHHQDKLVIGNFQEQSRQARQQPYQYAPTPQQSPSSGQPAHYRQRPPETPRPYTPASAPGPGNTPNTNRPPYYQPGGPQQRRPRRRRRGVGCLVAAVIVIVLCVFAFSTLQKVLAFGSAISKQTPLSTQTGYMSTADRTNVLIMGYGGGSHDGANLTDSIAVVSLMPQSHHTSLISVPRDLWVQNPPNSGQYSKINAVYSTALAQGKSVDDAGNIAAQKISVVTGLDVKYWLTINFTGFRDLINSLGGVDVYVPDSFNACYPKNDDAAVDASWLKAQFNKGMQHMDGATAIEYARAREPLEVCGMGTSENQSELTDFARSARQQIIMKAVLAKVKQVSTWPHLFDAMSALQHTIYTNMSLADLSEFVLHMDLNDSHTAKVGLRNAVVDTTEPDGEAALSPANNNWQTIADYVKQNLYN